MFGRKKNVIEEKLDRVSDKLLDRMLSDKTEVGAFAVDLAHLERVRALSRNTLRSRVSMDTVVSSAASVLGILIIVAYEQKHVMVSKGLGFVPKPK